MNVYTLLKFIYFSIISISSLYASTTPNIDVEPAGIIEVRIACFREKNAEISSSLEILKQDCEANFTPYVEPSDITIGTPWLTEEGPNYIAFDKENTPLGFLAVGWNMSQKEMTEKYNQQMNSVIPENISSQIRADFTEIKDYSSELSQLITLSPAKASEVFGGSYNIFIYVSSNARGRGIGQKLMSCLPGIMQEKFQEGLNIRYSSKISNLPSIALFLKTSKEMDHLPDVYLKATKTESRLIEEGLAYDQMISFLLSPNSEGSGYNIIDKFIKNFKK
ncbi:MAG: GNAT family N-acetyltransferase [Pseudomonadota bacterium]